MNHCNIETRIKSIVDPSRRRRPVRLKDALLALAFVVSLVLLLVSLRPALAFAGAMRSTLAAGAETAGATSIRPTGAAPSATSGDESERPRRVTNPLSPQLNSQRRTPKPWPTTGPFREVPDDPVSVAVNTDEQHSESVSASRGSPFSVSAVQAVKMLRAAQFASSDLSSAELTSPSRGQETIPGFALDKLAHLDRALAPGEQRRLSGDNVQTERRALDKAHELLTKELERVDKRLATLNNFQ